MSNKIALAAIELQKLIDAHDFGDVKIAVESRKGGSLIVVRLNDEAEDNDDFAMYAPSRGYDPEWLNKRFTVKQTTFTIVGVRPNATKNCMNIRSDTGKVFSCSVDFIRRAI